MASLEEDMKLGDLSVDMPEHTGRLEGAMPYTLVLFALAAFAALVLWAVYAAMAGFNVDDMYTIQSKYIIAGNPDFTDQERDWFKNDYRAKTGYEGAVLGFLAIISYACVYGALKIAHRRR